MAEIILSILLGISILVNIISIPTAINGIKIEQKIEQTQTTINNIHNINDNRNINTVSVNNQLQSITNHYIISNYTSSTNTIFTNKLSTNLIIKKGLD